MFSFTIAGQPPCLRLPYAEALDLFEWLGLGRPEFGAIEVRDILPRCRRRLWPEARNDGPMRQLVAMLAAALARNPYDVLFFG